MKLRKYNLSQQKLTCDSVADNYVPGTFTSTSDLISLYKHHFQGEYELDKSTLNPRPKSPDSATNEDGKKNTVGFTTLLSLAGPREYAFMAAGSIGAFINGGSFPALMVIFGLLADVFISEEQQARIYNVSSSLNHSDWTTVSWETSPTLADDEDDLVRRATTYTAIFAGVGVLVFIAAFLQVFGWQEAAARQTRRLRTDLFDRLLHQPTDWLDRHTTGDHIMKITDDVETFEGGIGDKMGTLLQHVSTIICSLVIGIAFGWQLTFVMLAISPFIVASGLILSKVQVVMGRRQVEAYGAAGGIAQEAIGAVRTVMAFSGQQHEVQRYTEKLEDARKAALKRGLVTGVAIGAISFNIGACYCLGWWYGAQMILTQSSYTPGRVLAVFLCILLGLLSSRSLYTDMDNITHARSAAFGIFSILNLEPEVTNEDDHLRDITLKGNIVLENVTFSYPSRPEIEVLKGVDLEVHVGKTAAVVGPSGSGKSTLASLLQKLYPLSHGAVTVDGRNIADYDTKWLRRQVGAVSQDPVLFAYSIADNIRLGRQDATFEEVQEAATWANIHKDIVNMPQGYDTVVGDQGCQLSGGQRQRVALARALLTKPSILILDEATSALDNECERRVHEALRQARHGLTTIIIAHRLSTVRDADVIFCMNHGRVIERGTHSELLTNAGLYKRLYSQQATHDQSLEKPKVDEGIQSAETKLPLEKRGGDDPTDVVVNNGGLENSFRDSFRTIRRKMSILFKQKLRPASESKPTKIARRLFALNKPELAFIVLGSFFALLGGAVGPAFALLIGEVIGVLIRLDSNVDDTDVAFYACAFLLVGFVDCIISICTNVCLAKAGAELTTRLRHKTFSAIMSQDMTFFDAEENSAGALGLQLATDTTAVQGVTGAPIGRLCNSVASLGSGFIIGLIYSWKLTFVLILFIPPLIVSGYFMIKLMQRDPRTTKESTEYQTAARLASEALDNHRTVKAFGVENKFIRDYGALMDKLYGKHTISSVSYALGLGVARSLIFFIHAVGYTYGAYLIQTDQLTFTNMYKVFRAIVFGSLATGQGYTFAPSLSRARQAGMRLFSIIDRQPRITSPAQPQQQKGSFSESLSLRDVFFTYPARPGCSVLNGVSLTINSGQTVALVGGSGAGKSTIMALLQRMYDADNGSVRFDGVRLDRLDVDWLRSQIGVVSQNPTLFNRTIRENICYGDLTIDPRMQDVIHAAKQANIHGFIASLPQGYETVVGPRGVHLSGGQKQRITIARALLRQPAILLLDEPTASLDSQNEKMVQEALEQAQTGRTCVVIAHRLSTVRKADVIVVLDGGQAVEVGTHAELLAARGAYYHLHAGHVTTTDQST